MSQAKAHITELSVAETIRVFFDEAEQHCNYDIHPLQDRDLLESIAYDNGTGPGLHLSVLNDSTACIFAKDDPRLSDEDLELLESNESTGEFAGREWQLRAHLSDGEFIALTSGNHKEGIEQTKALLVDLHIQTRAA